MKLINPTLKELEIAFARNVAGITDITDKCPLEKCAFPVGQLFGVNKDGHLPVPPFTRSFDAVLPWLERMGQWEIERVAYSPFGQRCRCRVWPTMTQTAGADHFFTAFADGPARAAVIALLRAHGVEVEFT